MSKNVDLVLYSGLFEKFSQIMTNTGLKRLISVFGVRVPDGSLKKCLSGTFFYLNKKVLEFFSFFYNVIIFERLQGSRSFGFYSLYYHFDIDIADYRLQVLYQDVFELKSGRRVK